MGLLPDGIARWTSVPSGPPIIPPRPKPWSAAADPKPGEVSMAHHGILFLDELPEFSRHVLETLRQPLESGEVTVARVHGSVKFPAKFMLVAAMNPTASGYAAETTMRGRDKYLAKLTAHCSIASTFTWKCQPFRTAS